MAFSCGFFNSKGLDRTYTAENFCDYLGSIICNGILDTYGDCFKLTTGSGLSVTLGTGKAWIDGHYLINDAPYNIELSQYMDESLPRYVAISILLDVSDTVRSVALEITPGTPAENPTLPTFPANSHQKRLVMYAVRLNVGATKLTANDWYDYREDENVCGYCKCILGKCQVTELMTQVVQLMGMVCDYNDKVTKINTLLETIQTSVDDVIGGIIEIGQCGDNAHYVLYSNGKVLIHGSGDMYDYDITENPSPFYENDAVKKLVVSDGITSIGETAFERCMNLENVSLPATLMKIGRSAFMPADSSSGSAGKLTNIEIPQNVIEIGGSAFWGSAITSVKIPQNVATVGRYVFRDCQELKTVRYEGSVIGGYMFVGCSNLTEFTIAHTVTEIGENCFNYCTRLETIVYEGSMDDWKAVKKGDNWAAKNVMDIAVSGVKKIQCLDGYFEWNNENKEWTEVKA